MSVRKPMVSVEEYLESEKDGTIRHEYVDGEVYAMSGASKRHNRVATNLTIQLSARLRGGPCQVFISDVKVFIQALNYFYTPMSSLLVIPKTTMITSSTAPSSSLK